MTKQILSSALLLALLCASPALAQTKNGEWRSYGGDVANTRYSGLDQVNASNFNKLEVAWRFKTFNLGPRPEYNLEGTPLMANGVVYATAGSRRASRAPVRLRSRSARFLWASRGLPRRGGPSPVCWTSHFSAASNNCRARARFPSFSQAIAAIN